MKTEKILKKLHKKAEVFENTEISEDKILDYEDINDFQKIKGKLYFIQDNNYFLKDTKNGWVRFKEKKDPNQETKLEDNKDEQIRLLIDWTNKFKQYVDKNLSQLFNSIEILTNEIHELKLKIKK